MILSDQHWRHPPPELSLSAQDVHAWRASLKQPPEDMRELMRALSDDEVVRAERFHFERDRRRFIVGRGVLRAILGRYLGAEPRQVRFDYADHGKPYLSGKFSGRLFFNLAHSHELALYAFTREREIGVDVERVHPLEDAEQIAARFFAKKEVAAFRNVPESQKLEAFFNCWTRKEAFIKAIGDGLTYPLDQFEVSLIPAQPARLLSVQGSITKATHWSLEALIPDAGYVGAIIVQGQGWQLKCWQWSGYLYSADYSFP